MRIFFRAPTPGPSSPQAIKPATALATSRTITVVDGSEILAVRPEQLDGSLRYRELHSSENVPTPSKVGNGRVGHPCRRRAVTGQASWRTARKRRR
jgi:hypothetical protein